MKKIFLILAIMSALISSVTYTKEPVLSAKEWDKQHFSALNDDDKTVLLMTVRAVKDQFGLFNQAIDKGSEKLLEAYGLLMGTYQQLAQLITPSLESYRNKQQLMAATIILPALHDIQSIMQKILPEEPQNERELKRAINKGMRNKQVKDQLKNLAQTKYNQINACVDYLTKEYSQLTKQLDDLTTQVQALLQDMQ